MTSSGNGTEPVIETALLAEIRELGSLVALLSPEELAARLAAAVVAKEYLHPLLPGGKKDHRWSIAIAGLSKAVLDRRTQGIDQLSGRDALVADEAWKDEAARRLINDLNRFNHVIPRRKLS